jgi:hypothetical protein
MLSIYAKNEEENIPAHILKDLREEFEHTSGDGNEKSKKRK